MAQSNERTEEQLKALQEQSVEYTRKSLEHMARHGIYPEGRFGLFLPPDSREKEINRLPYTHPSRQVVVYETEQGEFSALCPFSGLPDFGVLKVEYVPGDWILELKSLKYYLLSWRSIGATQEDITAVVFEDLKKHLQNAQYLVVSTFYNIRGVIRTTCVVDSRLQQDD
jgi:7-cyano-7-deazaguanine reductase